MNLFFFCCCCCCFLSSCKMWCAQVVSCSKDHLFEWGSLFFRPPYLIFLTYPIFSTPKTYFVDPGKAYFFNPPQFYFSNPRNLFFKLRTFFLASRPFFFHLLTIFSNPPPFFLKPWRPRSSNHIPTGLTF